MRCLAKNPLAGVAAAAAFADAHPAAAAVTAAALTAVLWLKATSYGLWSSCPLAQQQQHQLECRVEGLCDL